MKEFIKLKPLILLIGISKINEIHSARQFISVICLNSEKGTLIDKISHILNTHIEFITWFDQIDP